MIINQLPLNKQYLVPGPGYCISENMKKQPFNLALLLITFILCSCHGKHRPVTTIQSKDNTNTITIRYDGTVSFTADSSAIEGLSPMSTLHYSNNDNDLQVTSNEQGQLTFEMSENGNILLMDSIGKAFVAKAVKVMIAQGVGKNRQQPVGQ